MAEVSLNNTPDTQKSWRAWFVWSLGAAFFFAEYFARVSPSVMVPQLMQAFQVDAKTLGLLSVLFYVAYISMQLPVGGLVDKWGPHRLLTFNALLCALGCVLFGFADHLSSAAVGRLLIGFGAAFAMVGTLKLASAWFPSGRFGLLAGMTQALGMLGAVVGDGPLSWLVTEIGWRRTMIWVGLALLWVAVFIAIFVRDRPSFAVEKTQTEEKNELGFWLGLRTVLGAPRSWMNAAFCCLLYGPSAVFAELWGVQYLRSVYHLSQHMAAAAIGFIFIGWAFGAPLNGWLSDRWGRRQPVMLISAIGSAVSLALVLYAPGLHALSLIELLFVYGIFNSGLVVGYAHASELHGKALVGTALAFANMASILGALFQPLVGWLLDLGWGGQVYQGVHAFSVSNYRHAFAVLPLCSVCSIIFAGLVRETYCQSRLPEPKA